MDKEDLTNNICIACEDDSIQPMGRVEAEEYLAKVSGWTLSTDTKKISKEYIFKNFMEAMNFVKSVAEIAEREGHHPDISIHYNKVLLELWTHNIDGLSTNDFIVAAKVDVHTIR